MVYFFNGFEDKSYEFLDNFQGIYNELSESIKFSPQFVL